MRKLKALNFCILFSALFFVIVFSAGAYFFAYKYPRGSRYTSAIHTAAAETGVPAALIFSICAAESKFSPKAVSAKGASGIMQLMPDTAAWTAEIYGVDYSYEDIFNAECNIRLGAYYIKYLLTRFNGNLRAAVAAYNAGEGNVARWLAADQKLTKIPFKETREYVKKVLRGLNFY